MTSQTTNGTGKRQTLTEVKETLEKCKRTKADKAMARAMLRVGRLTDEARAWVAREYPQ